MKIDESDLSFSFDASYRAIKFDDTSFYRSFFNQMPGAKGVDIVADSDTYNDKYFTVNGK